MKICSSFVKQNVFVIYCRIEKEKSQLKNEIADMQDQLANASKKGVRI